MRKLLAILLLSLTNCGLLGTYDNVELMIGLEVPVYTQTVRFGMHMILKDQAINKIQEKRKTQVIDTYMQIIKWKQEKSNVE